jgi:hypothetical protein
MFENEFVNLKPKRDQACQHSPGPKYNVRGELAHKWGVQNEENTNNKAFGKDKRFVAGRSFVPINYGPNAVYLPLDTQVNSLYTAPDPPYPTRP